MQLSDSEKLDAINRRVRRIETSTHIQTFIIIVGFIGIVSFASLVKEGKKILNSK